MADATRRVAEPYAGVEPTGLVEGLDEELHSDYWMAVKIAEAERAGVQEAFHDERVRKVLVAAANEIMERSPRAASLYVVGSPQLADAACGCRGEDFATALEGLGKVAVRVAYVNPHYCETFMKAVLEDLGRGHTLKGTFDFYAGPFVSGGRYKRPSLEEIIEAQRNAKETLEAYKGSSKLMSYLE